MEDESLDRISNLPPSILETILCRLPTKEAVRTCILSTEWKHHWTKLPKFEFEEKLESVLDLRWKQQRGETTKRKRRLFSVINQLISMHNQCPVEEFSLTAYVHGTCVEVDRIIDYISNNNNLKKLKLDMGAWYWIPQTFFSFHKLTDLYLVRCRLHVPPTFTGFPSLTNLFMNGFETTKSTLRLFLSRCPLLKTVTLIPHFRSLPYNDDMDDDDDDGSTLAQLFECLPVVENLTVRFSIMKFYDQGGVPNLLPAIALVHLKHLCILDAIPCRYRFHCFVFLVRSCQNMEKLTLNVYHYLNASGEDFINGDSYSDIWLEHLNEVEIYFATKEMTSLFAFKLILAKSPMLKKVTILLSHNHKASDDEKLSIERTFSRYPRVSRVVEFIVKIGKLTI